MTLCGYLCFFVMEIPHHHHAYVGSFGRWSGYFVEVITSLNLLETKLGAARRYSADESEGFSSPPVKYQCLSHAPSLLPVRSSSCSSWLEHHWMAGRKYGRPTTSHGYKDKNYIYLSASLQTNVHVFRVFGKPNCRLFCSFSVAFRLLPAKTRQPTKLSYYQSKPRLILWVGHVM
jgi:hypothetical protein